MAVIANPPARNTAIPAGSVPLISAASPGHKRQESRTGHPRSSEGPTAHPLTQGLR